MKTQSRSKRKLTGGLYHQLRKKKKYDFGSDYLPVKIAKTKKKTIKVLGGNKKQRLLQTDIANVLNLATGKSQLVKILTVKENPANPHFVRMNVITKGAIIETELGLAKVTSRPGQHGAINAVLIKS